jgi:hypothetical protein
MAIVYEHIRNDTNEVFYVGIGKKEKRAFSKHGRNPHWKNIVNKVGYTVNIVYKDIEHKEAKKIEILLIEKYGRKNLGLGNLVNMTDGGDGLLNPSIETRKKIGEGNKGKTNSYETRQKLSEVNKGNTNMLGKTHTEESKKKMSEALKGKTNSYETRQKMSEAHKGKILSEETRQKMSESKKGNKNINFGKKLSDEIKQKMRDRIISYETRQKISEANKGNTNMLGKTHSEETRQKLSIVQRTKEGVKGYYFNKSKKKYQARIRVGRKQIDLGRFDTPEEASQAYQKARLIYFV